jgi:magnesium and cobalt transporter
MEDTPKPTLLERLSAWIMREPEDRAELIQLLHSAFDRNLLDGDALAMIEGAIQMSEMHVRHVMIPRSQMDVVDINDTPDQFIPAVIQTAHSRFPVVDRDRDHVIGILLAKDLLQYYAGEEEFSVREMLRPAVFVPESKRLNVLLREFRASRNHMAIVVDEYGGVAGLVTIEDVLEQIVGDIEDEHDFDEAVDNIIREKTGAYRVKAMTDLADFNQMFGTLLASDSQDTIGGIVIDRFGHLPKRNESIVIDDLRFVVRRADSRRVHTLQVERIARPAAETEA